MTEKQASDQYTRVVKIGDKWTTFLRIDHQEFCVVEQTTAKRAKWFAKMLAIALCRLVKTEAPHE